MSKPKRPRHRRVKAPPGDKVTRPARSPKARTGRKPAPEGIRLRHFYDVRQYAILTDAEKHVLILQLPKEYDETAANTWTLPGGKLEPDDEPGEGLLREIAEETGLTPEAPRICALARWTTRASKKLAVFYRTRVGGVKPELKLSGEHQRAVWASPDELHNFPFHRADMLETVQKMLNEEA